MLSASPKVGDAAKQVATAVSDLADTYGPAEPKGTPNTAALTAAIDQLKTACAAG